MTITTGRGTAVTPSEQLSPERLLEMLRQMVLIRHFDELALQLIWSKRIEGVVHPYVGQESSAVGICGALRDGDRVISNHRGHGHCIAAGTDINRMMAELFGRVDGYCKGKGGSMHIADFDAGMLGANGIVGAGPPMAVGAALSNILDGNDNVTVAFFGEGATGQGIVWESMNIAALWKLPVLFVCENNGIASGTPMEGSLPVSEVAGVARGHGLTAERVDGGDVAAVNEVAQRAVAQLRAGEGPFFLESVIDRWGPHASRFVPMPDDRSPESLAAARERDPILRLRSVLEGGGHLDAAGYDRIVADVDRSLSEAIEFAEASPLPDPADALEDVFA
jgi:TPP-dependent pyruvate/acetoin dehydrogenase alpha subunit